MQEPNIGKMFKTNISLITKYLNQNWNIAKSLILILKMIDLKKIVLSFRLMLCAQFNPMLHHFTI